MELQVTVTEKMVGFGTGWCFLDVQDDDGKSFMLVAQLPIDPEEGMTLDVLGDFEAHDVYGVCFIAVAAGVSADDFALSKASVSIETRKRASAGEDAMGMLDAKIVSEIRGDPGNTRVFDLAVRLLRASHGYGATREEFEKTIKRLTDADERDIQAGMDELLSSEEAVLTSTSKLVLKKSQDYAEILIEEMEDSADYQIVDEIAFQGLCDSGHVGNTLSTEEVEAVRFALNHRYCLLDVVQASRRELITESLEDCYEVLGQRTAPRYCDMMLSEPFARAMKDSGWVPYLKVPMRVENPLDAALQSLRRDGELELTAATTDGRTVFRDGYQDDFTVHALTDKSVFMITETARSIDEDIPPHERQVVCLDEPGAAGSHQIASSMKLGGVPVAGPWCLDDKVWDGVGTLIVDEPGDGKDFDPGWAITIDQLGDCQQRWYAVTFIVDERTPDNLSRKSLYSALSRASGKFTVMGTPRAVASLGAVEGFYWRDEALYAALLGKKRAKRDEIGSLSSLME